jgi:hypothetical protein
MIDKRKGKNERMSRSEGMNGKPMPLTILLYGENVQPKSWETGAQEKSLRDKQQYPFLIGPGLYSRQVSL